MTTTTIKRPPARGPRGPRYFCSAPRPRQGRRHSRATGAALAPSRRPRSKTAASCLWLAPQVTTNGRPTTGSDRCAHARMPPPNTHEGPAGPCDSAVRPCDSDNRRRPGVSGAALRHGHRDWLARTQLRGVLSGEMTARPGEARSCPPQPEGRPTRMRRGRTQRGDQLERETGGRPAGLNRSARAAPPAGRASAGRGRPLRAPPSPLSLSPCRGLRYPASDRAAEPARPRPADSEPSNVPVSL